MPKKQRKEFTADAIDSEITPENVFDIAEHNGGMVVELLYYSTFDKLKHPITDVQRGQGRWSRLVLP